MLTHTFEIILPSDSAKICNKRSEISHHTLNASTSDGTAKRLVSLQILLNVWHLFDQPITRFSVTPCVRNTEFSPAEVVDDALERVRVTARRAHAVVCRTIAISLHTFKSTTVSRETRVQKNDIHAH